MDLYACLGSVKNKPSEEGKSKKCRYFSHVFYFLGGGIRGRLIPYFLLLWLMYISVKRKCKFLLLFCHKSPWTGKEGRTLQTGLSSGDATVFWSVLSRKLQSRLNYKACRWRRRMNWEEISLPHFFGGWRRGEGYIPTGVTFKSASYQNHTIAPKRKKKHQVAIVPMVTDMEIAL